MARANYYDEIVLQSAFVAIGLIEIERKLQLLRQRSGVAGVQTFISHQLEKRAAILSYAQCNFGQDL